MSVMSSSKLDAGSNQHSSHAAMSNSASSQSLSNHSTSSGIGVSANGNREVILFLQLLNNESTWVFVCAIDVS